MVQLLEKLDETPVPCGLTWPADTRDLRGHRFWIGERIKGRAVAVVSPVRRRHREKLQVLIHLRAAAAKVCLISSGMVSTVGPLSKL
ncbi:hypothetical protein AB0N17_45785 [Streptomyces sp. NPDC051133]|uniref:hypothetical protein n=1 Tax=Streptomyces sp. NPDC051133 TaxID=3155521 RepID=UPI0034165CD3